MEKPPSPPAKKKPPAKRKAAASKSAPASPPPSSGEPPAAVASQSAQARALNDVAIRKGIIPPPPAAPDDFDGKPFDPESEAKKLNVWRLAQAGGCFLIPCKGDTWSPLNKNELMLELKAREISTAKKEDGSMSDAQRLILYIQRERNVEMVLPALAGHKAGIYVIQGNHVLVRQGYTAVEPEPGDFPTIRRLIESILKPDGGRDLTPYFYGWLKVAYQSLRAKSFRVGQILYLIGPAACGKSRLQNQIITPLLGNRAADPSHYLTGKTEFNGDLVGCEHLQVEDPDVSPDFKERDAWGKRCKQIAANDSQRLHPKGKEAITARPFWRVSVTQNDEQNSLEMLPPMEVFADKVVMLHCQKPTPEQFRFGESDDERQIFCDRCKAEMAAFAAWLLAWQIPEKFTSVRYGVASYIDPWVTGQLTAHSRETALLECIDVELFRETSPLVERDERNRIVSLWQEEDTWKGNATDLSQLLTAESSRCRNQARGLFKNSVQLGKLLSRLSDERPDRVKVAPRQAQTNGWLLYRAPNQDQ